MTGEDIIRSMVPMHNRSNGLGGGFAAYGIYPVSYTPLLVWNILLSVLKSAVYTPSARAGWSGSSLPGASVCCLSLIHI